MTRVTSALCWVTTSLSAQQRFCRKIPNSWDNELLARLELAHSGPRDTPLAVPAEYYYVPGGVPFGYLEALEEHEPRTITFEPAWLGSQDNWINADQFDFDTPLAFDFAISNTEWNGRERLDYVREFRSDALDPVLIFSPQERLRYDWIDTDGTNIS